MNAFTTIETPIGRLLLTSDGTALTGLYMEPSRKAQSTEGWIEDVSVPPLSAAVRQLTEGARGADAVIEAVGRAQTWEWALQIVRKGGTVNLFGGCPSGTEVKIDPAALHYAEITIKSTFHHTPQFIREALETIARGEIRASDFVTGEVNLDELPKLFQDMKNRNGELKTAVIP